MQDAFMKLSADSETVLMKVTCSEQEVMIGSGVADPVGLEVTTGASTVLACSSCTSVRAFEVSVSRMFSVASWK